MWSGKHERGRDTELMIRASRCVIAACLLLMSCVQQSESSSESVLVLEVGREGDDPRADGTVLGATAGSVEYPSSTIRVVGCMNIEDWASDISLDTNQVVSTEALHVRVAELAAGGDFPIDLIRDFEQQWWSDPYGETTSSFDRFEPSLVESYQSDRLQPPSPEAQRRYVVFVARSTRSAQRVVYVDVDGWMPPSTSQAAFLSTFEVDISGGRSLTFTTESCTEAEADQLR